MESKSSSASAPEAKVITMENASKCTPYDLRQELTKRGAMDIPDDKINFKSLLQRMMVELVKDEEKRNEDRRIELEQKQKEERDRLKEERERRKQEALERSKQRREADPEYFEKRKQLVDDVSSTQPTNPSSAGESAATAVETLSANTEEEEEEVEDKKTFDPFRSYQAKSRNKIFVK